MNDKPYPRDLIGYGPNLPHADWPGGTRLAVQFVISYEEGGESNNLYVDAEPVSYTHLTLPTSPHV